MNEEVVIREGPEARRDDRHGRAAAAGTGDGRPDRERRPTAAGGRRAARRRGGQAQGRRTRRSTSEDVAGSATARRSPAVECAVNISEIFIRRPIATSLPDGGDRAVRRRRVPRAAGQRSAARWIIPTHQRAAPACPAAIPATMASSVASPLERQFTTIAGVDSMIVAERHRQQPASRCSSISTATSTAPTVDVQTAIAAAMPLLPAGDAVAAVVPQAATPPTSRSCMLNLTSDDACRCRCSTTTPETMIAPRISMVSGVSQVQVQGASEVRGARAGRSRQAARAAASASTRSIRRCRTGTSTCRPGSCSARPRPYNIKAAGQLNERRGVQADRRRLPATARRSASNRSPTSSTASRTTMNGSRGSTRRTATAPQQRAINAAGACGSRAATPSRSPTPSARCCRRSSRSCRRRCTCTVAPAIGRGTSATAFKRHPV